MNLFRQGDVLIMEVSDEVQGEPVPRESGRIVLAHGEVTGHAHAVTSRNVQFLEHAGERYLVAKKGFQIRHEEHATVRVPAGTFQVIRQREYSPEEIRNVAD